jgi:putative membrane protein
MWDAGASMGWWMVFGGFLWIVFLGTVIYLVVTLITDREPAARAHGENPAEIAKRRYAGGEITREEYERIRHDLAA